MKPLQDRLRQLSATLGERKEKEQQLNADLELALKKILPIIDNPMTLVRECRYAHETVMLTATHKSVANELFLIADLIQEHLNTKMRKVRKVTVQ